MAEATAGQQLEVQQLFVEDLVCAADDPSRIGLISEVYGQDEDEDEYEYEDEEDKLEQGEVRVCWKSGEEELEDACDLTVVDRALMHGDIVGWNHSPLEQTGHVIGVELLLDLETADGTVCRGIPSTTLRHIRRLRTGHYVVHGVWLGRVQGLSDAVHVQLEDGSLCRIAHATIDTLHIKDETDDIFMDEDQTPFYPGQRVRAASAFILHHSQWLRGSFKGKRDGVVVHVEVGMVDVDWIAACKYSEVESQYPPDYPVEPQDLRVLTHFDHTCWQLCDRALLRDGVILSQLLNWGKDSAGEEPPPEPVAGDSASACVPEVPSGPNMTVNELVAISGSTAPSRGRPQDPVLPDRALSSGAAGRISSAASGSRGRRRRNQQGSKKTLDRRAVAVPDVVKVVKTYTKVDIQWQDGRTERGIEASRLAPLSHFASEHELWPEEFVEEMAEGDEEAARAEGEGQQRIGLVRSVDAKARLATITWLKRKDSDGVVEPPTEDCVTEKVSVYEVREHADYQYRIGDTILRLSDAEIQHRGRVARPGAATVHQPPGMSEGSPAPGGTAVGGAATPEAAEGLARAVSAETEETLAWVGEVVKLKDGLIEVAWANGTRSSVTPDKIYVVSRDEEEDGDGDSFMDGTESGSWETMGDEQDRLADLANFDDETRQAELRWGMEEMMAAEARYLQRVSGREGSSDEEADHQGTSGPSQAPETGEDAPAVPGGSTGGSARHPSLPAVGEKTKENATLLANIAKAWNGPSGLGKMLNNFLQTEGEAPAAAEQSTGAADNSAVNADKAEPVAGQETDGASCSASASDPSVSAPSGRDGDAEFDRYGEVNSCTDHSFRDEPLQPINAQQWQKRILKEMKTLSRNLPDTIWVRSYAEQLGLFRAAILGAKGTPYHDNLFFFDIYLPPAYPDVPPEVKYHSHGRRINPNLYENGKVCLSLLNTWNGREDEMWNPETSTLLQVLVSLQGLVLVPKPYFNEAGYEKQVGTREGEHNASLYNENTFLLSCRAMMDSIRLPPEHFTSLVIQHFNQAAPTILSKIEEYLTGHAVGLPATGGAGSLDEFEMPSSEGFRLLLGKLKPKVAAALETLSTK